MPHRVQRLGVLLLVLLAAGPAAAASGDLDPGLLGGRVHTDFDGFFDQAQAAVVLPDGKVVAAGLARRQIGSTGGGIPIFRAELALARYTAAGVLDATFGTDGVVRTDFGQDVDVRVLLRDPSDGDLIAVGNTPTFQQLLVVARYDADGAPDASVGGGTGHVVTAVPGFAYTGLVLPDGKLMIGGSGRNPSGFDAFLLARLHPNGTPDDAFDADGFLVSSQGAGIRGMLREADGDLVVAGWRQDGSNNGFLNFVAARFTAAGAVDGTFGGTGTGRISIDFFNASGGDQGRALARLADGTLVVGGFAFEGSGVAAQRHFALAFLDANGALDLDFGGGTGKVTTDFPGDAIVRNLLVQSTGGLVAVGESGKGLESTALASDLPELSLARYGAAGALDPTFGDDGTITHRLRGTESPRAAVLQPDDKPIVVGRAREDWQVLRLTPTGQADPTFGSGGRVLIQGSEAFVGFGGALQPDGKILVAGRGFCQTNCGPFAFQTQMAVTRHLPDGRLDATFGDLGLAFPQLGGSQIAVGIGLQSDGKILAAGTTRAAAIGDDNDFAVVRLDDEGGLDPGFGSGGLASVDFFGGEDNAIAMAVQPADEKVVVVGDVESGSSFVWGVARFTTTGDPDPGFGSGGKVTTDLPGAIDQAQSVLVQPDGKILVVGSTFGDTSGQVALVRYLPGGTPDPDFGTGGVVVTPVTARFDGAADALRLPDGRIIVAGWVDFGGDEDFLALRYLENGTLDDDFGTGGLFRTDVYGFHRDNEAISLARQADGKLLLLGDSLFYDTFDFAVARLGADGALDTGFGFGGHMVVDLFDTDDFDPFSALLQTDGRLVGIGTSNGLGFFRMETTGGPQVGQPPPPTAATTTTTLPGNTTTTTSTLPGGTTTTTTTLPGGGTTTTTTLPGATTTTTTLPPVAELCGNCVDDDGNGRVDYDDAACCAASGTMQLKKAQLRGGASGGKLSLTAFLAGGGLPDVDATAADLYVRLATGDGTALFCGRIPASAFVRKKKVVRFVDKRGAVGDAAGLSKATVKRLKDQRLQVALLGKRARLAATTAGPLQVTLAFDDAGGAPGRCAAAVQAFRTLGKNKGVRFP